MAIRTVDRFYDTYPEAVEVVADLTAAGLSQDDVSVIDSTVDPRLPAEVSQDGGRNPAGTGANVGMFIGGALGALVGVGAVTVPFLDPLVQAGWIVPTITFAGVGAAVGALLGLVTRMGVTNRRAHSLAEGLDRGRHLVVVRVDERSAAQVEAIMDRPRVVQPRTDLAYDMVPVDDERTPGQVKADIHRHEQNIQYESE